MSAPPPPPPRGAALTAYPGSYIFELPQVSHPSEKESPVVRLPDTGPEFQGLDARPSFDHKIYRLEYPEAEVEQYAWKYRYWWGKVVDAIRARPIGEILAQDERIRGTAAPEFVMKRPQANSNVPQSARPPPTTPAAA